MREQIIPGQENRKYKGFKENAAFREQYVKGQVSRGQITSGFVQSKKFGSASQWYIPVIRKQRVD